MTSVRGGAAALLLGTVLIVSATGCASIGGGPAVRAAAPVAAQESLDESSRVSDGRSTGQAILDGVLSVPETALWWPYKIVGATLHGIGDGVADGVDEAPVRALGILASPITGALGAVRGLFRGIALEPLYIPTTDALGRALPKPWTGE